MKEQATIYRLKYELEQILVSIPFIEVLNSLLEAPLDKVRVDLLVELKINDKPLTLVVESKSQGEPRIIRSAMLTSPETASWPSIGYILRENIIQKSKPVFQYW
jgi:hypothetical protein